MLFLKICGRYAPYHYGRVCAALAHYGHPRGRRRLHGLRDIGDNDENDIPYDRVKDEHPPRVAGLSRNHHHEMHPEKQYHGDVHGEDRNEHVVPIGGDRRDRSLRSDTRAEIRGEPRQRRRPCMYRLRHRNDKYPAKIMYNFRFLCILNRCPRSSLLS